MGDLHSSNHRYFDEGKAMVKWGNRANFQKHPLFSLSWPKEVGKIMTVPGTYQGYFGGFIQLSMFDYIII